MSGRAQLFIGRLHKDIKVKDLEDVFDKYGRLLRCDVKYGKGTGMAYAFVDYDDRRDAEDAIKYENGRELRGHNIVVEWARGPAYRPATYDECYRCHRSGHWARDCPDLRRDSNRYHSRSRSRSRSRRRRSRSRSYRSRSYRRSHRSSSPSPARKRSRDRRSSRSKSRSRSYSSRHSRSRSVDRSSRHNSKGRRERSDSKDRSSKVPKALEVNGKDSSPSPGQKRREASNERDSKIKSRSRSR